MKKLGFGLMRLPLTNADDIKAIDIERVKAMADEFMKEGFTYFDTAACYHEGASEPAFKEAVAKRYPRDAYSITSKLSLFMMKEASEMPGFFDKQLENLGVDYMDVYLIHALNKGAYEQAKEWGAFEFVNQKKAEGKVKHVGFSFHDSAEVLEQILSEQPEVEYVQLQINYLDWESNNVQSRKCYEVAKKYGKKILIMEPVKGGTLANVPVDAAEIFKAYNNDASIASWAIRFAAGLEGVVMVLSGMSNEEQMNDNLSYMKDFVPLNDEEQKVIDEALVFIKASISIPCTGCRYCVEDCPMEIPIPDYFMIYNEAKRAIRRNNQEELAKQKEAYAELAANHGKASDCIECGMCEGHCPQFLPIRKYLKYVAEILE